MKDLDEGLTPEGFIKTGVRRDRVPAIFEPVIESALEAINQSAKDVSIYLYGSVATGRAIIPSSDVDLLTIGLPAEEAKNIAVRLSTRFSTLCRDIGIAAASLEDFQGDGDAAYGGRVFLRHYCVLLDGRDWFNRTYPFRATSKLRAASTATSKTFMNNAAWKPRRLSPLI